MSGEARFETYPQEYAPEGTWPPKPTGEFGWRFQSANGRISAVGGEGFTRREDARRAIVDFLEAATNNEPNPPIIDVDEEGAELARVLPEEEN